MKDLLKRIKLDAIVSAAACITFGIVLILWPVQVTTIACQFIAVIIAILGAVRVISYIMESEAKHRLNLPLGLVLFVIGIWIFLKPASIQNMLFRIYKWRYNIFKAMRYAFYAKSNGYLQWWQLLMMALLGMGLGIACIVDCFGIISMTLTLVGVALVYDGVTLLWVISRVQKAARRVKREVQEWDAVESDITAERDL